RGSFVALGCTSLIWVVAWGWYFRDNPADHKGISDAELKRLPIYECRIPDGESRARPLIPWARLTRRMLPVTIVYFCYAWTLWLYLNWLPSFFLHEYRLDIARSAWFSSAVFFAGVAGDLVGGVLSDRILKRTGNVRHARRTVVVGGFVSSCLFLLPIFATREL